MTMTVRDLIRTNLKKLRIERGIPARKIARLLDVETNHIYRIEKGESALMPEYMDKICQEYNIEPTYFLTDHSTQTSNRKAVQDAEIPPEIYNELMRVKDLSPAARSSVIDFIKFQIKKIEDEKRGKENASNKV